MTGPQTGAQFLALGDSYTIGEGVAPSERWPVQLANLLRAEGFQIRDPEIVAETGWTTGELWVGMDRAGLRGNDDLVSLLIGVNNQYRGLSDRDYSDEFARLLDRAIALAGGEASRVIVLSIPDWGMTPFAEGRDRNEIARQIDRFNAINRAESERRGAAYVDVTASSRRSSSDLLLLAPDGLHPSGKMYAEWARLALTVARAALTT